MTDKPDASERPTVPPIGNSELPRDQERLAMRFAADVARALEPIHSAVEKSIDANQENWRLAKDMIFACNATLERTTTLVSRFDERIAAIERWRDRNNPILAKADSLAPQVEELAKQVHELAKKIDSLTAAAGGNGPRAA